MIMIIYNVKGVTRGDKPTGKYHLTPQLLSSVDCF